MKIAAQLYTVRKYTQTEEGLIRTIKALAQIGYESVQLSGTGPYEAANIRRVLDELGMTACATHVAYERIVSDTDALIEQHAVLGTKYIGLGYRKMTNVDEANEFLRDIVPAAHKIKEAGMQFVYHNHHWEFIRMENGKTVMEYLLENTDEAVGLLPDLYWLQYAGVPCMKFIRENATRIGVVHLKDMAVDAQSGQQQFAPVLSGNMDYGSYLPELEAMGIEYAAVEQDDCYGLDPMEALRISYENIIGIGGGKK